MHKLATELTVLTLITSFAPSLAVANDYKPYLGLNYAYTRGNAKNLRPDNNSIAVLLGSEYNRYFGTELFYQYSDKDSQKKAGIDKIGFNAYGLDLNAYLPLACSGRFSPMATMGIAQYTYKEKFNDRSHNNDHGWGYRFGGGLRYQLDDNINIRAIARYIHTDKIRSFNHNQEYTLGLSYTFR